jgi:hypothetical protein
MTSGCGGEPSVTCEQRCVKRFRESHIDGVIGREVVPQIPDTCQKKIVRIPSNWKIREIGESLVAPLCVDLTGGCIAAQHLGHFDIDEVRRVQCLLRVAEKTPPYGLRCRRLKQDFQQCRCVDDDHRWSRSARTASAGAMEGVTAERRSKRSRNSSTVGRAATSRISLSK